jgi:hypothetical protein
VAAGSPRADSRRFLRAEGITGVCENRSGRRAAAQHSPQLVVDAFVPREPSGVDAGATGGHTASKVGDHKYSTRYVSISASSHLPTHDFRRQGGQSPIFRFQGGQSPLQGVQNFPRAFGARAKISGFQSQNILFLSLGASPPVPRPLTPPHALHAPSRASPPLLPLSFPSFPFFPLRPSPTIRGKSQTSGPGFI